jgi:hypothetical protein
MMLQIKIALLIGFILSFNSGLYPQNKKDLMDILYKANEINSTVNMDTCNT